MPDTKVDAYLNAVVETFTVGKHHIRDALQAIAGQQRKFAPGVSAQALQLLAVRRYLRAGGAKIVANWPWTVAEQQTTYSAVIANLLQAAEETKKNFERANPGLTLKFTRARDLDRQAYLWVTNTSVKTAAADLLKTVATELSQAIYLPNPGPEAAVRFKPFLERARVHPEPTNAAPGLSDHGQMKAVDFYVEQNGRRLADIRSSTIGIEWRATGFDKQLKTATERTGLVGPLKNPYEPWHYSIPLGTRATPSE